MMIKDLTNPILSLVGDQETEHQITVKNNSSFDHFETCLNLVIPSGASVDMTLIGDAGYLQLQRNAQQINLLNGFTLLEITEQEPVE